ncbi:MAG: hypothetical protein MUQ10_05040, partial [Anaerolineae bacterium]|nr:hypothetical protein [Anaerolineae bacterium]
MLTIRRLLSCAILCALMLTACQQAVDTPEPAPPVEIVGPEEPTAADEESAPTPTTEPTELLIL